MDEKRTELIYSVAISLGAIFGAFKGVLPAETVAWIMFWLAIGYMVLRTGLKIAKVIAAATPSIKDDAIVAAIEALSDRLKIPKEPVAPAAPPAKAVPALPEPPAEAKPAA